MAVAVVVQLNPVGMLSTEEGYISSITLRSAGGNAVFTPDASNQIGVAGVLGPLAMTRLVVNASAIKLVTGAD